MRERVHDPAGDYTLVWHCDPPPYYQHTDGAPTFIVTSDEYKGDERHIYSWEQGRPDSHERGRESRGRGNTAEAEVHRAQEQGQ